MRYGAFLISLSILIPKLSCAKITGLKIRQYKTSRIMQNVFPMLGTGCERVSSTDGAKVMEVLILRTYFKDFLTLQKRLKSSMCRDTQ